VERANYERRRQFFDGESVWDTADYRKQYVDVTGSGTAQQVIRKTSLRGTRFSPP